jgi:hypothetical protein
MPSLKPNLIESLSSTPFPPLDEQGFPSEYATEGLDWEKSEHERKQFRQGES